MTTENRNLRMATGISAVLMMFAILICTWYYLSNGYVQPLDPEMYTTIGRDARNRPTATVDIDAILRDYGLPNPSDPAVRINQYPDVAALCAMKVFVKYADAEGFLHVAISVDSQTLLRYGLRVEKLEWDQALPQGTSEIWTETEQEQPEPQATVQPSPTMEEGILVSLLDSNENGLNLRAVCERVHKARDEAANAVYGEDCFTTRLSTTFLVQTDGTTVHNTYRVFYRVTEKTGGGDEPASFYLTVDIIGLKWFATHGVTYTRVDTARHDTQEEATAYHDETARNWGITKLSGSGVMVEDKGTFDQNGFVRFYGEPTSFCMPNGVYWSPTYDLLTENMIWRLTATQERSLVNLLRYARREIYARHGLAFDEKTEKEFYDFYQRYPWFQGTEANVDEFLSDNEKENVRLLREIQSLLEN